MARQNSTNAQEGRGMAEAARVSTERGVEGMGRLSESIKRIKASSDETGKIVKTIDEIAFQTNLLALNAAVVVEIATGSDQQAEGIEQITTAVGQMNQVTQRSASNAEESAAAEELSAQSEEMKGLVDSFRLSGGNGRQTTDKAKATVDRRRQTAKTKAEATADRRPRGPQRRRRTMTTAGRR